MQKVPLQALAPREGRARRLNTQMLVSAAGEIADRDGLEALTLASLAEALGVKTPSLYAHIASMKELRFHLAALALRELEREIMVASLGLSGTGAIAAVCHAYRRYAKARPGVYQASITGARENSPAVTETAASLMATALRIVSPSLGSKDYDSTIHALRLMRISLHGFVALEAVSAFGEPVNIDESFERLTHMIVNAVG